MCRVTDAGVQFSFGVARCMSRYVPHESFPKSEVLRPRAGGALRGGEVQRPPCTNFGVPTLALMSSSSDTVCSALML